MQDGNQPAEEAMQEYRERGQRLADMLAAHVAEQQGLVATYTSGQVDRGPAEGMPVFVIVVARQVGYPHSAKPNENKPTT